MRFKYDATKSELLRRMPTRGIGFDDVIQAWDQAVYLDARGDDPVQWRAIGWIGARMFTVIYEEREDELGPYVHLVTLWRSTKEERSLYENGR